MVCDGPDPPDNTPHEITPPARHELTMNGNPDVDSDEEQQEHFGYEPLPQVPDAIHSDHDDTDDDSQNSETQEPQNNDVPVIEPMDAVLTRQVWNAPQPIDPIQMDNERAQQVMSAMANFALPHSSIPEWAQSITEDQWKQTLNDRIEKLKTNR